MNAMLTFAAPKSIPQVCVTVGRYGARTWGHGGIYTTKIYRRVNGSWRLDRCLDCHATAGKGITKPMIERAKIAAEMMRVPFIANVTQYSSKIS